MKRRAFERWLTNHGCSLSREGARHSWYVNVALNRRSAVPRHPEIDDDLIRKICRDLGIERPLHT
jgi:predicted RNA binding protein YcfA (HicA-like mRNA interferase family)